MEPNDDDKVTFLNEHFAYEVEELLFAYSFSASLERHKEVIAQKGLLAGLSNTALEHFLLHARVLLEFLFYDPNGDEPRAMDYVADWKKVRDDANQLTDNIKILRKRVNKEIAHLSWDRVTVTPEEKKWSLIPIGNDLLDTTILFLSKVDTKYKKERIQNLYVPFSYFKTSAWDIFGTLMIPSPQQK